MPESWPTVAPSDGAGAPSGGIAQPGWPMGQRVPVTVFPLVPVPSDPSQYCADAVAADSISAAIVEKTSLMQPVLCRSPEG